MGRTGRGRGRGSGVARGGDGAVEVASHEAEMTVGQGRLALCAQQHLHKKTRPKTSYKQRKLGKLQHHHILAQLTLGTGVFHRVLRVHGVITNLPAFGDFLHKGKVLMQFPAIERKEEQTTCERRAFEELDVEMEDVMLVQGAIGRPQLDTQHERARKIAKKVETLGAAARWGAMGARKTAESHISIEDRVEAFPNQSFTAAASPAGKVLFCQCCPKKITNILGTIRTHIASERHQESLKKWLSRGQKDDRIARFLHDYYKLHPNEKDSSTAEEQQVYQWRVVECALFAGIPLHKIDDLRPLLERHPEGTMLWDGNVPVGGRALGSLPSKVCIELARLYYEFSKLRPFRARGCACASISKNFVVTGLKSDYNTKLALPFVTEASIEDTDGQHL
ncbi:hypothetical protein AB1Y20_001216 [Prymnesium parvum]|uniref:U1-type domain-containing protein n=1 Tax=Prymnesium parvum TaxID=97485 RepID=A0AB34KBE0_PRYPA